MNKILVFFIFLLVQNSVIAQQETNQNSKVKLLYLVDGKKIFEEDIDNILKRLTYANTDVLIFNELRSINSFYSTEASNIRLKSIIAKIGGTNRLDLTSLFENDEKENDKFMNYIGDCNKFLHVKIDAYTGGFEVKLELYALTNKKITKLLNNGRIFINPTDKSYYSNLKSSLKKLFSESHVPSEIEEISSNYPTKDSVVFASVQDTVILTPKIAVADMLLDVEYFWTRSNNSSFAGFKPASSAQRLYGFTAGIYKLSLIVSDGLSKSNLKVVILNIQNKPSITALDNKQKREIIVRNTLFGENFTLYSSKIPFLIRYYKEGIEDSLDLQYTFENPKRRKLINSKAYIKGDTLDIIPSYSLLNFPSYYQASISANTVIGYSNSNTNRAVYYRPYSVGNNKTIIVLENDKDLLTAGTYNIKLSATKSHRHSDTTGVEVIVKEQRVTSLYVNYLIFPVHKVGLMNATLNYGLGINLNYMQNLSISTAIGTSIGSGIPQKLYGELGFNIYDLTKHKEGTWTVLLYENPTTNTVQASLGLKYSYLIPGQVGDSKIGVGVYYTFNKYFENVSKWVVGLNFGGNIHWNKRSRSND